MLRQYELVERVKSYDPDADEELLNRAYVFSMKAHGAQLRASGDPYFSHPIEVAGILTDLHLDDETIATAILHDTVEDTVATQEQIEKLFGPSVGRLVDGVTKLSRIEAQTDSERAAENFRKFLLAMSDDIRVLLVKLADRLHNMRTLHHISKPDKRRRIARETMEIYAPLAERIGMYEFMNELQELSFKELEPEGFAAIQERLQTLRAGGGDLVARITSGIKLILAQNGIEADVTGREKRPFSIWRKMEERHIAFEKLSDVMAFRVIVADVGDCYRALGVLHQRWPMVPGRFKDFISTPKRNGYRSLHTTLIHNANMRIEVQIRTGSMHRENELGLAAHWAYKQGLDGKEPEAHYPWLQDLLEILENAASPEELLEHAKLAMYQDTVFCFTPKGELIQLPKGSTPVDFAYALHTGLGDTTVGAKINGRVVPLRTQLANGDQVEILRSKAQEPDPAWETFVVTGKARSAIRRSIRHKERDELIGLGLKLYDEIAARVTTPLSESAVDGALKRLKLTTREALFIALAKQTVSDEALLDALLPGVKEGKRPVRAERQKSAISIKGLTPGVAFQLADCCHPIPGDRIVGVRRPGTGIEVHTIDCAMLEREAESEWVDLAWSADSDAAVARLQAVLRNEPGSLAVLTGTLAQAGVNIVNLHMKHRDREFHTFTVDVEVDHLSQLTSVIASLRAAQPIVSVDRVKA
ncbi:MAG: bifunctional (p)ppGpp synthetase/guanosine-3',5'-bis(diphosphate) 3'-pyrophosphohydrolase [Alphaproteobacteria bacterium]|nr:bifunctional (p)ppGpp synthetase/guanosine-3',5'-bis(diphosphate) 3'-pyrophosphohydrolase [Alphaproteobacteria bacterium]